MRIPNRLQKERKSPAERECPGHRAWVRAQAAPNRVRADQFF